MNRYLTIAGTFFLCIVFILIFAGCDPIYKTRLPKFAEDVKAVVNPTNLQGWAVEMMRTNSGSEFSLNNTNVPLEVRNLNSQGSPFQWAFYDSNCVCLVWGSGFGHWGIRVGSQSFKPDDTNWNYYIEWKPGIYFWHETH